MEGGALVRGGGAEEVVRGTEMGGVERQSRASACVQLCCSVIE
jgi:hypothetical protein